VDHTMQRAADQVEFEALLTGGPGDLIDTFRD
jgi:hypothetical protein